MINRLIISTIFLAFTFSALSQIQLSGYIYNADSVPIAHANILIHDISNPNKLLVKFTTSDNKGFYTLKIEDIKDFYLLTVRATSYQTLEKPLKFIVGDNTLKENFTLYSSVSYLDTVKVDIKVSISHSGDTITFNPDAFLLKNETNIEDLLKRLPGIEVKDDGKIFFNGKQIQGVLIEGDDLFKNDYQLLTKNAAPKIVDRVQVIRNYQKDLLLKEFNQVGGQVINLKIKEQYKNYLFGNFVAGYGNKKNKLSDLFLIRLGPKTKIQSGINYNTIGTTYNLTSGFDATELLKNESYFFTYQHTNPLLSVYRYHYQNIPDYYQQRNNSLQAHTNLFMKRRNWEILINGKYSEDKLNQNQKAESTYSNGTFLFTQDAGILKENIHDYKISVSKNSNFESIYINARLQKIHRDFNMQTASNQSLNTHQLLFGEDLSCQLNMNYNRKIKKMLWSSSLGYFNQIVDDRLETNPDFLFWVFPDDLSLNRLSTTAQIRLQYVNLKSSLLINSHRMTHGFSTFFSSEKRIINSAVHTEKLSNGTIITPFLNDNQINNPDLSFQYEMKYQLTRKERLNFKIYNEPNLYKFKGRDTILNRFDFFYDYSFGLSSRTKSSTASLTMGIKRKSVSNQMFFTDYIQTSFHRLQAGYLNPIGEKSTYLQATYNLFSIKMGWIAFFNMNFSRNENKLTRNVDTKGIGTIHSFLYHPHNTNQLFFIFNSQKTLGDWPLALNNNLIYNLQSVLNSFNQEINKSFIQFLNAMIGFKSMFKSSLNFDYNFSLMYSKNKNKAPNNFSNQSNTILNKLNLYLTSKRLLNTTLTFNNMIGNRGEFNGNFLDIKLNRKLMNERLLLELNLRNIFNKKNLSNTTINSLYIQENRMIIRGAEFFITLRYEFK